MANEIKAFKPAIDIKSILASVKPQVATKAAKATKEDGTLKTNTKTSNLSGFKTIHATHEYCFATSPLIEFNQMELVMNQEYPFAIVNKKGEVVAEGTKGSLRARLDKDGKVMMSNGKPVTRAYVKAHFGYYRKAVLGNGKWTIGEDFGVTDAMKEAAQKAYADANPVEADETDAPAE